MKCVQLTPPRQSSFLGIKQKGVILERIQMVVITMGSTRIINSSKGAEKCPNTILSRVLRRRILA